MNFQNAAQEGLALGLLMRCVNSTGDGWKRPRVSEKNLQKCIGKMCETVIAVRDVRKKNKVTILGCVYTNAILMGDQSTKSTLYPCLVTGDRS